jgi:diaminopimelate decarboxylase
MLVQFLVTVNISNNEPQNRKDFERNDGKEMLSYLQEKLQEKLQEAIEPGETWQSNAIVTRSTVKQVKQRKKK